MPNNNKHQLTYGCSSLNVHVCVCVMHTRFRHKWRNSAQRLVAGGFTMCVCKRDRQTWRGGGASLYMLTSLCPSYYVVPFPLATMQHSRMHVCVDMNCQHHKCHAMMGQMVCCLGCFSVNNHGCCIVVDCCSCCLSLSFEGCETRVSSILLSHHWTKPTDLLESTQ